jgi:hypothetical protein
VRDLALHHEDEDEPGHIGSHQRSIALAALVPLLRALPALSSLALVEAAGALAAAALRGGLAAAAPRLEDLVCVHCSEEVLGGATVAASQLACLGMFDLHRPMLVDLSAAPVVSALESLPAATAFASLKARASARFCTI